MKKFYIAMMAVLLSGSAIAAPVDATSAKEKAAAFLKKQAQHSTNARRAAALRNPQLNEANAFGNALHVFNIGNDNGFVIVSGDDRTEEILGYVDGGNFDYNNMPDNMRFWLQMYADQINSLGNSTVQKAPNRAAYANIEPLTTTDWDQIGDYNDKLFFDGTEILNGTDPDAVYTGCAATSMAQALYQAAQQYKKKHGEWPSNPTTTIPSYTVTNASGKINNNKEMKALEPIVFDWANMIDNYARKYGIPTDEQIDAVAMLMTYCGRAMHMEYGTNSSDAAFVYMPFRMADYFGIQPYVKNADRSYYTSQKWEDMIYNELAHGRAVPYTGVSGPSNSDAGHAFILDGYKDGLWHINWGWGIGAATDDVKYNGYFSLSYMQPNGTGIVSGGALGSEYKYLQQATIGVSFDPVEDVVANTCYVHQGYPGTGYTASSTILTYLNYSVQGGTFTLDGAWAIDNEDGTYTILKKDYENRTFEMFGDMEIYPTGYYNYFYVNKLPVNGIADGTYKLIHVSSLAGQDNWVADDGTDLMNFTITVANNKISDVVYHPIAFDRNNFHVTKVEFEGSMEANADNVVRVTIQNDGDDFFGKLAMYYNTEDEPASTKYKQNDLAPIKPGLSTHEFTVNLKKGVYNLWFFANGDSYRYTDYAIGTGQMYIGMGDLNLVTVDNVLFEGEQEGSLTVKSVNGNLDEITGSFDVTNGQEGQAYQNTYYLNVESGNKVYKTASFPVNVAAGQTVTVPFTMSGVTGLTSGQNYTLRLYSKSGESKIDVVSKTLQLESWYRYWKADGTDALAQELSTMDATAKADASAIDYRYISTLLKADNPNCLYYLNAANSSLGNGIVDNIATTVVVNSAYPFYAPEQFTANEISFTKTFSNGVTKETKKPYWETIVLPFTVNSVKKGTKNLKWFKSATDTRCHFWLMTLTDVASDALTFDYAQKFEANTPYIIEVPGEGYGDWDLRNTPITFRGVNVTVPVTMFEGNATFMGTYIPLTDISGLILDSDLNKFVPGTAVDAYNAYINAADNANSLRIVIAGDEIATGIENEELRMKNEESHGCIYDLQGRRVQHAQKGLYIQNGKVVVIK